MLIIKSAVKALINSKGYSCSEDTGEAVDALINRVVHQAIERARRNGRKVVQGRDV